MKKLLSIAPFIIQAIPVCSVSAQLVHSKPNVVLIIADDHRYDWMHHKGKPWMETPNLDRLALEGWSFTNAFSCAGVCSPARASIFTGKYMHQASSPDIVWQNNSFRYLQEMFPQTLHRHGYKTGYIGKFHLGEEEKPMPGFDLWASFPFVGNFFNQTVWINGNPVKQTGFTDDNTSALAEKTIDEWSAGDQPFCLIVGLKSPHIPFTFPDRMKVKYDDVKFPEPETFDFDYSKTKPGLAKNLINAKTWPQAIPKYGSFQEWVRSYSRLATTIDESVGRIMKAVEKAGITNNTIFIYTSDQGYSLGEFNLCEKHYAYEQIMRVPLIVKFPHHRNPSIPPADLVMNMDIAPTILDYCIHKVPGQMEGKSLKPLQEMKGKPEKPFRDEFFFDFWHNEREILPPMQAVRTEKFKYIRYEYQPYDELYDLVNDPLEKNNLANDEKYRNVKDDLSRRLNSWEKRTEWTTRSVLHLNHVYVSLPNEPEKQGNTPPLYSISELKSNNSTWMELKRIGEYFNIQNLIPEKGQKDIYLAVPVENKGNFDPFISLRFSVPDRKETNSLAYVAYYEGKEIYQSLGYKKLMGIPMVEPVEESLRKGFDLGYNPPLKKGKNLILVRIILSPETPTKWDLFAVGGLTRLSWL
jgi:N-acetylglucosamine-6-sulfatase